MFMFCTTEFKDSYLWRLCLSSSIPFPAHYPWRRHSSRSDFLPSRRLLTMTCFLWHVFCCSGRVLSSQVKYAEVSVAMSAMMKKDPTRTTLMNVTMSMIHYSATGSGKRLTTFSFIFPLYNLLVCRVFFGLHGVPASSLIGLHDSWVLQ